MRWLWGAVVLAGVGWAATCVTVVQQDEVGVVRRFGAPLSEAYAPGLHLGLPWPLDRVDRVKPGQARTLTVGAAGLEAAPLTRAPNPATDDLLTGDLNLVTAQAIVQYRVSDPVAYLFGSSSAERSLAAATESALARVMASRAIDDLLTTGLAETAERIGREAQAQADRLGLGISIRAVRLGRAQPPMAVAPAFADAARARSDRRQAVTAAAEYRDRALADATGQAREIADRAAARHDRSIALARGEADRFARVLAEARAGPKAARERLYLEALATLLPRFARKVVTAPSSNLDLGLIGGAMAPAGPPSP